MGCGSSKSDAVTAKRTNKTSNGSCRKENKDPSIENNRTIRKEAEQADLPGAVPESELMPPPVSFEISAKPSEPHEESLIKKHPPKRFQKLDEQQNGITNKQIQEKQMSAKERRSQHLQERIQSSRLSSRRQMSRSALPAMPKMEPTIPEQAAI